MTYTIAKGNQKKAANNKQAQDLNGNEFEEEEEEEGAEGNSTQPAQADLIQLVHDSNSRAAELFFQYSQAEEDDEKQELFDQIKNGLKVHAQLVEELYYPLLPETAKEEDKEEAQELVYEAEAGNYVAAMILEVLESMKPSDDYFDGKMAILHKLCKEQTKREEKEIFDKLKAAETEIDFEELGQNAMERMMELEEEVASMSKRSKSKNRSASASKVKGKAASKRSGAKGSSAKGRKSSGRGNAASKSKPNARNKSGKAKPAGRGSSKSAKKTASKAASKKDSH